MDFGFFTNEQLFDFFCQNKTKMCTIRDPLMLLRHLKDNQIITEDLFQDAYDPENSDESVYRMLDCIENRGPNVIRRFWHCVNREHILERYPQIYELTQTLKNELPKYSPDSSHVVGRENVTSHTSEEREVREEPSTSFTEREWDAFVQEAPKNLWDWPCYEKLLPVQCGEIEGLLDRERLYRREKRVIQIEGQLITPWKFEEMGGKGSIKNWKMSILCQDTPLKTLIERDILKVSGSGEKLVLHK